MRLMKTALTPVRFAWAMLFALMLATHSLAPFGFMPAFGDGKITIIACPDATDSLVPMQMDGAGHHKPSHQSCPFAAVSSLGALGPGWTPLPPVPFFAAALLLGRTFVRAERQASRERPPVRGPPIPA